MVKELNPLNHEDIDEEPKWNSFEGALLECEHRIRVHIATKLNRDIKKLYFQKSNRRTSTGRVHNTSNANINIKKYIQYIRKFEILHTEELNPKTRNLISKLENKIRRYIELIPGELRVEAFGNKDIPEILQEISLFNEDGNEWLSLKIADIRNKQLKKNKSKVAIEQLRDAFKDDARRIMKKIIWRNDSPSCETPLCELFEHHSKAFS